jgi:hypothetical protein
MIYMASQGCTDTVKFSLPYVGAAVDNAFSSGQTFNYCYAFHYQDANYGGLADTIYANDGKTAYPSYMDNQVSSIKWYRGPTRRELLDLCANGSTSCDFHPQSGIVPSFLDYHEVARVYNCSPTTQSRTITWEDVTGGSYTLGVEVGLSSGVNVLDLLTFERSIKLNFQAQWNWSKTYSDSSTLNVEPYNWVALDRQPKLQSVSGYFKMRVASPKWGYTSWNLTDFTGTGPVTEPAVTRVRGAAMTDAERADNCNGAVAGLRVVMSGGGSTVPARVATPLDN